MPVARGTDRATPGHRISRAPSATPTGYAAAPNRAHTKK